MKSVSTAHAAFLLEMAKSRFEIIQQLAVVIKDESIERMALNGIAAIDRQVRELDDLSFYPFQTSQPKEIA